MKSWQLNSLLLDPRMKQHQDASKHLNNLKQHYDP